MQAGDFKAYMALEHRQIDDTPYKVYPLTDEGEIQQAKDMYGEEWTDSFVDYAPDQQEFDSVMRQLLGEGYDGQ